MLQDKIHSFLNNPYPLWELEITKLLFDKELKELLKNNIALNNYSTEASYLKMCITSEDNSVKLYGNGNTYEDLISLEYPSNQLSDFYEEHGLEPIKQNDISDYDIGKLQSALAIFDQIPDLKACISTLVKRIQILKQQDREIDTSYSHPNIPFSIFISLCEDNSLVSNLRVAESILHEAMHLKLTLIEKHIDLIIPNTTATFYSPWRDEQRPIRGVLHGLFVFKAVFVLYKTIEYQIPLSNISLQHIKHRKEDILEEFNKIHTFTTSKDLTVVGANLVRNLLPLN